MNTGLNSQTHLHSISSREDWIDSVILYLVGFAFRKCPTFVFLAIARSRIDIRLTAIIQWTRNNRHMNMHTLIFVRLQCFLFLMKNDLQKLHPCWRKALPLAHILEGNYSFYIQLTRRFHHVMLIDFNETCCSDRYSCRVLLGKRIIVIIQAFVRKSKLKISSA